MTNNKLKGGFFIGPLLAGSIVLICFFLISNSLVHHGFLKFVEAGKTDLDLSNLILEYLYSLPISVWIGIQAGAFLATIIVAGVITQSLLGKYGLGAALITALTPNLFLWVGSRTGESILVLFASVSILFLVRYLQSERHTDAVVAGVFLGAALLTRGTLLIWPFLGFFLFCASRLFVEKLSLRKAFLTALVPFIFGMLVIGQISYANYLRTGHAHWSGNSAVHLAYWIYPCFAKKTGCGTRDLNALSEIRALESEELEHFKGSASEREARRLIVLKKLSNEKIADLGMGRIFVSSALALARQLIYTPIRNWFARLGEPRGSLINIIFGDKSSLQFPIGTTVSLTVIESINGLLRAFQLLGFIALLKNSKTRVLAIMIFGFAASVFASGVGIGNPRYGAAAEVVFIPLTFAGIELIRGFMRSR